MAVRLINLHQQALRVDLRGGGVLVLGVGQRSTALREELLYDNSHLPTWERAGWIARVPARLSEVRGDDAPVVVAAAAPVPAKKAAAKKAPARKVAAKKSAPAPASHGAAKKRRGK